MNDQNDEAQNYALMVLAGVVALVVAGVMALAVSTTIGDKAKVAVPAAVTAAVADGAPAAAVAGESDGRVYFESGSDALPAEATVVLAKVADLARAQAGKVVLISGFHDASGDADKSAELAKNRALTVRHALEANGVAPDHLVMDKPVVMPGGAGAGEAHRVELRLR